MVVQSIGDLLDVLGQVERVDVRSRVVRRSSKLGMVDDDVISAFFAHFGGRLADDDRVRGDRRRQCVRRRRRPPPRSLDDPTRARAEDARRHDRRPAGRSSAAAARDDLVRTIEHDGWRVEQRRAPLASWLGFVFEGRPNVFADATGVLRGGNIVVFRIGRDALRTARAIMRAAAPPALAEAGTAGGAVRCSTAPHAPRAGRSFSDPAPVAGGGARLGPGGRPARRAGPAGRHPGQPARHRRRVDRRRTNAPIRALAAGGRWTRSTARCATRSTRCCIPRARAAELVPVVARGASSGGGAPGRADEAARAPGDAGARAGASCFERDGHGAPRRRRRAGAVQAELLPTPSSGANGSGRTPPR